MEIIIHSVIIDFCVEWLQELSVKPDLTFVWLRMSATGRDKGIGRRVSA
jgi:hypothetical protein